MEVLCKKSIWLLFLVINANPLLCEDDSKGFFIKDTKSCPEEDPPHLSNIVAPKVEPRSCRDCGISNEIDTPYNLIINGSSVNPKNKYPWMVTLSVHGVQTCGGAIMNKRYIITAAHCVKTQEAVKRVGPDECYSEYDEPITCFVEASNMEILFMSRTQKPLTVKVAGVFPHPEFSFTKVRFLHDIALLKLEKPISCNSYMSTICLPPPNRRYGPGTHLIVTGWGSTTGRMEDQSDVLNEASITVHNPHECKHGPEFDNALPKFYYCLSGEGRQCPCFGDSGGPMFIEEEEKYYIIGVASIHLSKTCDPKFPVMYTAVAGHMQWIKRVLRKGKSGSRKSSEEPANKPSPRKYKSDARDPSILSGSDSSQSEETYEPVHMDRRNKNSSSPCDREDSEKSIL